MRCFGVSVYISGEIIRMPATELEHIDLLYVRLLLFSFVGQMTDVNITDLASNWHQERLQVPTVASICSGNESTATSSTLGLMLQRAPNCSAASSVSLMSPQQPSAEAEVKPTLYEELKLGHEGAGFKRLV